jgi:hypothetical protein
MIEEIVKKEIDDAYMVSKNARETFIYWWGYIAGLYVGKAIDHNVRFLLSDYNDMKYHIASNK